MTLDDLRRARDQAAERRATTSEQGPSQRPHLSDQDFRNLRSGELTPDDLAPNERRAMVRAYFDRLLQEAPEEWQAHFDEAAEMWRSRMAAENGHVTVYNPSGRRFRRKELRLMAQQWAFDSMGVAHDEHAETADALLARAREMERLGLVFSKHGLL